MLHARQELNEWACIYIKYIQIFRKLETAYDQMVHPQKRLDMKKALEGCMGRMLEIRHWMVSSTVSQGTRHLCKQSDTLRATSNCGTCAAVNEQQLAVTAVSMRIGMCSYSGSSLHLAYVGIDEHPLCTHNQPCLLLPMLLPLQVKLNRGLDFINLDDILVDLKLSPDVLEVPVPKYFIEDRAKVELVL